jgi:hypothetical protein
MDTLQLVLIALLLALILILRWVRARAREAADHPSERWLDTVNDWPPTGTRIMSTPERLAYETLVRALPGHVVLAQVPLARFIKVESRHSYTEWLRRMGHQCADLLVCDSASAVLAVVTVQPPPAETSERARNRHRRMSRVLKAAKIPLHLWTSNALPTADVARRLLLSQADEATASALARQRATSPEHVATRPGSLDFDAPEGSVDQASLSPEPPHSTWFDEIQAGSAANQSPRRGS